VGKEKGGKQTESVDRDLKVLCIASSGERSAFGKKGTATGKK